jgi:hypothetical protein
MMGGQTSSAVSRDEAEDVDVASSPPFIGGQTPPSTASRLAWDPQGATPSAVIDFWKMRRSRRSTFANQRRFDRRGFDQR